MRLSITFVFSALFATLTAVVAAPWALSESQPSKLSTRYGDAQLSDKEKSHLMNFVHVSLHIHLGGFP